MEFRRGEVVSRATAGVVGLAIVLIAMGSPVRAQDVVPSERPGPSLGFEGSSVPPGRYPSSGRVSDDSARSRETDLAARPLPRIKPGTVIDPSTLDDRSHVVLLSKPRLGSGPVDEVPGLAARYASLLNLVFLAKISQRLPQNVPRRGQAHFAPKTPQNEPVPGGDAGQYAIESVGVGFVVPIRGMNTVISSETQEELGAKLDFIGRRVLKGNEDALRARQVVNSRGMVVFDLDLIMLHQGEHRWMVLRHAVLLSRETGQVGTFVWLLGHDGRDGYTLTDPTMQYLAPGTVDDRVLNVKPEKFFLGVPAEDAFGIVRIPQGTPIPIDPAFRELASTTQFTADAAQRMEMRLRRAWQWADEKGDRLRK